MMYSVGYVVEWTYLESELGIVVNIDNLHNMMEIYWEATISDWYEMNNPYIRHIGYSDFQERIKERLG